MAGRRAYGWTSDDTALVDVEVAELHRIARDLDPALGDRAKSMKQVVRELNDRKVRTSIGGEWSVTPLTRMLKNPRMIGRKSDSLGRIIAQGAPAYPPVFATDDEVALWHRVRRRLSDKRRKQPRRGELSLLAPVTECFYCHEVMRPARPRERAPRYACHPDPGCGRLSIQMELADNHVGHEVVARAAQVVPGLSETAAATWWTQATTDEKAELVDGLLEKVIILPAQPGRAGAGRMDLEWATMPAWPASLVSTV